MIGQAQEQESKHAQMQKPRQGQEREQKPRQFLEQEQMQMQNPRQEQESKQALIPGQERIQRLVPGDSGYPPLLQCIDDPPKQLYAIGDIAALQLPCIGIVGARRATEYGRWVARKLAKRLSQQGIVVVSGMAEGIDAEAHIGALEGGTPTVAVMGTGVDICYPRSNRRLRERIAGQGLILSEYEAGTPAAKYTFPQRNRIVSGLSRAVVVVEAGPSSGSLITAELAVQQGREVYAVPGNINRRMSLGCNKLIRDGARPLVLLDDILADMGIRPMPDLAETEGLGDDERRVYEALRRHGELFVDDAARLLRLPAPSVSAVCTLLEMKGLIAFEQGRMFPIA
ncbi:MAG: DNA-processing protein DprA [Clostridiales Family XIII bacterium]|jgi:DNA processing protein|nr:DNA-processing protein DprA [Clostridiales Family XIII bacterium]